MPFQTLGLAPTLLDTLRRLGFEAPTPIQERAIPPILAGKDVVGSAETGSGKTAAFLLPTMTRLLAGTHDAQTRMLILVPTRELAVQVHTVATELAEGTGLGCVPVYGGVGLEGQAPALRNGIDIVVATPGRLMDHMGRGTTRFRALQVLVLDEADRMLDMGFLPDIRRILASLPNERQTLLFSATMPKEIVDLSHDILRDPERIRVGAPRVTAAPVGITHAIYPVPQNRKTALLEVLLRKGGMASVLVFCRTKIGADRLSRELARSRFEVGVMHGDRSQIERERDLGAFMDGYLKVLIATDVAARGLDVEGITHVVNYDFPRSPEDYLHRVGRTARNKAKGDAFALVSPEEMGDVPAVEREMGVSIPRVTLEDFDYAGRGGGGGGHGGGGHGGGGHGRSSGGHGDRPGGGHGRPGGGGHGGGRGRPGGGGGHGRPGGGHGRPGGGHGGSGGHGGAFSTPASTEFGAGLGLPSPSGPSGSSGPGSAPPPPTAGGPPSSGSGGRGRRRGRGRR